jgi:hypothetical protein
MRTTSIAWTVTPRYLPGTNFLTDSLSLVGTNAIAKLLLMYRYLQVVNMARNVMTSMRVIGTLEGWALVMDFPVSKS